MPTAWTAIISSIGTLKVTNSLDKYALPASKAFYYKTKRASSTNLSPSECSQGQPSLLS